MYMALALDGLFRACYPPAPNVSGLVPRPDGRRAKRMDKILWGIVVPVCLLALLIVSAACSRLPSEKAPNQEVIPSRISDCHPEPREDTQYLATIVAVAALLYCGAIGSRYAVPERFLKTLDSKWFRFLVLAVQIVVVIVVAALVFYQEKHVYQYLHYQNNLITVAGAAVLGLLWLAARPYWRPPAAGRWRRFLTHGGCFLLALACTCGGLSSAIYRDNQPDMAHHFQFHVSYQMAEFAAVLNGGTPDVDFFPQYQSCLSYLTLPIFTVVGLNLFSFTCVMALLGALSLLVFYFVFLRFTGGAWRALALYIPFLGASLFPFFPALPRHQDITAFTYFAVGPLRYFGPAMTLACLLPVLRRPSRFGLVLLFFVATLTAINNLDFGLPALVAAGCSVVLALSGSLLPSLSHLRFVMGCFLLGGLLALGVFVGITYERTGTVPYMAAATIFHQALAENGYWAIPMPAAGLHLVILLTFMAAIAKALYTPRLTPLRKGLLLYAGILGCGAMMYYVVRSHPHVLIALFLTGAFAFLLLLWLCWEETAEKIRIQGWRGGCQPMPLLLTLAYLALVSSVAELPNPRQQWRRLHATPRPGASACDLLTREIASLANSGEPMMVIHADGHLACLHASVRNLYPYAASASLILYRQYDLILRVLQSHQIRYVIDANEQPEFADLLRKNGYQVVGYKSGNWLIYCRATN
jgi:hypothetical protein